MSKEMKLNILYGANDSDFNSTHIFLGVTGQWGWLWTLPAPVLGHFGRALGAGGRGSRGPAITVSCAACTVGGAGTTAQWRVL